MSGIATLSRTISDSALGDLDSLVEAALASGDESGLRVLGYGEISLVLGWPVEEPRFACKRLPAFSDRGRFDSYSRTLDDYLDRLREKEINVVSTELRPVEHGDGTVIGYAVQPVLRSETLAPAVLSGSDPARGHPLVREVIRTAARTVGPRLGLDAQLANWSWDGARTTYLDITTPMLWSEEGRAHLDVDLLVKPVPWLLRGAIKRFLAPRILDGYRDLRGVYLDLCGNLIKERLEPWLPTFVAAANEHIASPLSEDEVRRYYRSDARLWAVLLAIRRLDRAWQIRVRRRPYPFLLPKVIER